MITVHRVLVAGLVSFEASNNLKNRDKHLGNVFELLNSFPVTLTTVQSFEYSYSACFFLTQRSTTLYLVFYQTSSLTILSHDCPYVTDPTKLSKWAWGRCVTSPSLKDTHLSPLDTCAHTMEKMWGMLLWSWTTLLCLHFSEMLLCSKCVSTWSISLTSIRSPPSYMALFVLITIKTFFSFVLLFSPLVALMLVTAHPKVYLSAQFIALM